MDSVANFTTYLTTDITWFIISIILLIYHIICRIIDTYSRHQYLGGYKKDRSRRSGRRRHHGHQGYREQRKHPTSKHSNRSIPKPDQHGITEYLTNMYKGAHLHSHFSGYVPSHDIIDMVASAGWQFKNGELSAGPRHDDPKEVHTYVDSIYAGNRHDVFKKIGNLLFNCIKTPAMYGKYLQLIRDQMKKENISHLELRLRLGSVDGWSIEEELATINSFADELRADGMSIVIIPQMSKANDPNKVDKYFKNLCDIITTAPKLREIVRGCDIVGNEDTGN